MIARPRPDEISVVVQGPIVGAPERPAAERLTLRALESVRRQLPRAEIVLSTWEGADVRGLPFDRLVQSPDPGAVALDDGSLGAPQYYTVNRQIVSSREGLRAASRAWAMKLRSDMLLTGTGFLDLVGRFPARAPEWRVTRERILTPTHYARNPHSSRYYAFHPSDWWQFGRREDVLDLWDVPLATDEEARWYERHAPPPSHLEPWALYRYTAEQHVWLGFLRKHGVVDFAHKTDARADAIELSELTLANNLVLAEPAQLGVRFMKYPTLLLEWETLYTHGDWERLYRRYCDPRYRPALDLHRLAKRGYGALLAPAHRVLASPSSSPAAARLSAAWRRRFPDTFRAAKGAYLTGMRAFERLVGR